MDRDRPETSLRLLAEAELRRALPLPRDSSAEQRCAARVWRVAQLLTTVRGLGYGVADQIMDDLELALAARRARLPGDWPLSLRRPDWRPLRPAPTPDRPRIPPDRVVPAGQLIPVRSEEDSGEICLLSYAQTDSGTLLTLVAHSGPFGRTRLTDPWPGRPGSRLRLQQVLPPFRRFSATDDRGTSYQMTYRGNGSHLGEWTLTLHPDPPRDLRWLDLCTTPGEPAVRIGLNGPAGRTEVTVSPATTSPGEQLLANVAMRLLVTAAAVSPDRRVARPAPARSPGPLTDVVDGLGNVLAALQTCGALSPVSPVLGQVAALCAHLNVRGHGITVPPARELPAPWLSLLAHCQRRRPRSAPRHDGYANAAVALPELDGIRLAILGLRNSGDGTVLHMHASHEALPAYYGPVQLNVAPAIWIRDRDRQWHATRVVRRHEGDDTTRLKVVPPLSRATTRIEVLAAGQSAEIRAFLPLNWQ